MAPRYRHICRHPIDIDDLVGEPAGADPRPACVKLLCNLYLAQCESQPCRGVHIKPFGAEVKRDVTDIVGAKVEDESLTRTSGPVGKLLNRKSVNWSYPGIGCLIWSEGDDLFGLDVLCVKGWPQVFGLLRKHGVEDCDIHLVDLLVLGYRLVGHLKPLL